MIRSYLNKIITIKELLKKVGPFPRDQVSKKLCMCHGVFDLVHPGHIRHLTYAKSHGNLLLVSITADMHVKKAEFRPYVPQQLRAENLAALEFVDYVIIDREETPLKNLKIIKPDFFVKGFEYNSNLKNNPKTSLEEKIINSYGGKFLFTPGDFVMSSSKIIENETPDLSLVKLKSLMEGEKIDLNEIITSMNKFKNVNVLVVGDTIVDSYVETSLIGNNAKTPTFSTKFLKETKFVGGAAIVACHMRAAGAKVKFCTVLGNDNNAKFIKKNLRKQNIIDLSIIDKSRPTTEKKYFIADNYRLLKVDIVENFPINLEIQNKIINIIKSFKSGIIVFTDFRHGIFFKNSVKSFIKAINKNVFKVADSQVASRWGNILDFKGFNLITPNEKETRFALADQDTSIRPLASNLYNKAKCKVLIFKLGSKGILTLRRKISKNDFRSFFVIDALEKNAIDPVGCGDALISYASLALYVSKNSVIASFLGSVSAAIVASVNGNIPVTKKQVETKVNSILSEIQKHR